MSDSFLEFMMQMRESAGYLKIQDLKGGYSYIIYARNAYVGVWDEAKKAFVISRYKVGSKPYLFREYHWDTGEPFGTVKPLKLIEECPFGLIKGYGEIKETNELLKYLDDLEEKNPIITGVNSLQNRKQSAINFSKRLRGDPEFMNMVKSLGFPVRILEGVLRLKRISKKFFKDYGRSITFDELLEKSEMEESNFNKLFSLLENDKIKQYAEFKELKLHNKIMPPDK